MDTIRVVKNKNNPFITIDKTALHNEKLSLEAVGLLALILTTNSKDHDEMLVKIEKERGANTKKLLKELERSNSIEICED